MADVELAYRACTECDGTGKCPACGGRARVEKGTRECPACDGGVCYVCQGTAKEKMFLYKGRSLSGFSSMWRRFMAAGILGILGGAFLIALVLLGTGAVSRYPLQTVGGAVVLPPFGVLIVLWSLRLRRQDRGYRALQARTPSEPRLTKSRF